MVLSNIINYPGVETYGVFAPVGEPKQTKRGRVLLVSNSSGLFGVVTTIGTSYNSLVAVTDKRTVAEKLVQMAVEEDS